jgi:predicted amidohydrolase
MTCAVYLIQFDIQWEDKKANFREVRTLIEQSPPTPGSLVILPEMFSTGFSRQVKRICETESRDTTRFAESIAKEWHVGVVGGRVLIGANGKGLNQCFVLDENGTEIACYTKLHPFSFAKEDQFFDPGTEVTQFEWKGFQIAPFICYDLRFPEIFRRSVINGTQVFIVIANWPDARAAHWECLCRARAIENQAWVVAVNRCGKDPRLNYIGGSMVINPKGECIAQLSDQTSILRADLDLHSLMEYRAHFPVLNDIRHLS